VLHRLTHAKDGLFSGLDGRRRVKKAGYSAHGNWESFAQSLPKPATKRHSLSLNMGIRKGMARQSLMTTAPFPPRNSSQRRIFTQKWARRAGAGARAV
jgi:hypothetical protein